MEKEIILLMKQKFNLLLIIEELNKAKHKSRTGVLGGNPSAILNNFATGLKEIVSNQLEELDNNIADIAKVDSIYFKVTVKKDGDSFCCYGEGFINLQESNNYAFGDTFEDSIFNYQLKLTL